MNIGKKYMGPRTSKEQWRDIAAVIEGPALPDLQALFLDDWAFSTGETLPAGVLFRRRSGSRGRPAPVRAADRRLGTRPRGASDLRRVFAAFHGGPAAPLDRNTVLRPDDGIGAALRNAALRGVDVRLIVPGRPTCGS